MKKISIVLLSFVIALVLVGCSEEEPEQQNIQIQLHFDSNGGTDVESITKDATTMLELPNDPVKEGYVFGGWFWDNHTFKEALTANSLLEANLSGNMTVYAKWDAQVSSDQTAPNFEGLGDVSIRLHEPFEPLLGVRALDEVDGDVTNRISYSGIVDVRNPGTYTLTYRVEDESGNVREEARNVTVELDLVLPDDEIHITLWHAFGDANQVLLQQLFDSFNEIYPNVTISQVTQGGYSELHHATINAITAGTTPTIVMGYAENFVEYVSGTALVPLDAYMSNETLGVDLDDFVPGFLAENQQYADGFTYSMPFAKSTEVLVYNKTVFDHHGISISNNQALTWTDLEEYAEILVGGGDMQCEFLFNADSPANFFFNASYQWGSGYTTSAGELLLDNPETRDMLAYYKTLMNQNILAFPIEWDQYYGSTNFLQGDVCMTQGSTAGVRYNNPLPGQVGKFGQFEIGVAPIVQLEDGAFAVNQQGPNIAILSNASNEERLAAWLLIKHMTNPENSAFFAMNTGYVPVRLSAFEDPTYQDFLNTNDPWLLPYAMAAKTAYAQVDYYQYEPAFVGPVLSTSAVRQEVGYMLERIYTNTETIEDSLQQMLDELGQ